MEQHSRKTQLSKLWLENLCFRSTSANENISWCFELFHEFNYPTCLLIYQHFPLRSREKFSNIPGNCAIVLNRIFIAGNFIKVSAAASGKIPKKVQNSRKVFLSVLHLFFDFPPFPARWAVLLSPASRQEFLTHSQGLVHNWRSLWLAQRSEISSAVFDQSSSRRQAFWRNCLETPEAAICILKFSENFLKLLSIYPGFHELDNRKTTKDQETRKNSRLSSSRLFNRRSYRSNYSNERRENIKRNCFVAKAIAPIQWNLQKATYPIRRSFTFAEVIRMNLLRVETSAENFSPFISFLELSYYDSLSFLLPTLW